MKSKKIQFDKNRPFNDLPFLPPAKDVETKAILKATISARTAITELKNKAVLLPKDDILIHNLSLVEAKDSSEIENIFTTHDKLYQADFLSEKDIDPNTKEVTRYRTALWRGIELVRKRGLNTNTYVEVVQIIKQNKAGVRSTPGTKIVNPKGELIYTPPEGEDLIRKLLANLDEFVNDSEKLSKEVLDIDPLIKMAILHYQFEAIHPFGDGNGRTGRILNILYLVDKKLLSTPILFLSRYIIKNKSGYYKGLQNVTENGNWEDWILYMLKAVEETAYETIATIDEICELMKEFEKKLKKDTKFGTKDLVEVLFQSPFSTISTLVDAGIAQRGTSYSYLKTIEKLGLLEKLKVGKSVLYINKPLYRLLRK
jgi:Fic family protein